MLKDDSWMPVIDVVIAIWTLKLAVYLWVVQHFCENQKSKTDFRFIGLTLQFVGRAKKINVCLPVAEIACVEPSFRVQAESIINVSVHTKLRVRVCALVVWCCIVKYGHHMYCFGCYKHSLEVTQNQWLHCRVRTRLSELLATCLMWLMK